MPNILSRACDYEAKAVKSLALSSAGERPAEAKRFPLAGRRSRKSDVAPSIGQKGQLS
jgi:hypothetical protein